MGALEDILVIELGHGVSAPYCARLFADYGARVIKVEPPNGGDVTRRWGPFPDDVFNLEASGTFQFLNTNKQGITLDVMTPRGGEILRALLERADALIENNHPATMRRWGLDYESLAEAFPQMVEISITPYGQTGPYSEWKGYDLNAFHF